MNKVDKFFKDKLETHALQPSTQAWEKVESNLSKKNKMTVWLRAAAAVALLGVLGFVLATFNEPEKQIVEEKIEPKEQPTVVPEQKKDEQKQIVVKKKKKPSPKKVVVPVVPVVPDVQPEPETVQPEQQVAVVIEETPKKEKSITLVYSLPTIKKEQPAEEAVATVDEPKKTGLERVLEIAKEVKNADNPLGHLREAKDDIFAFEFKNKDKNKKQN